MTNAMHEPAESAKPSETTPAPGAGEDPVARARTVDKLFRDHNQELVRFLQVKLRDEGEAKEVAQEAYVRLLQLEDTGAVSFLRAYLFRIAANLAFDRLNSRKRIQYDAGEPDGHLAQATDPLDVERVVLAAEELGVFLACLDELPPKCRQVFLLHRLRKLGTQQVAAQLNISDRMVRKHIARALIYCRYRLDGLSPKEAMERIGQDNE
jgi:RNA polymerase sigma-70 factor (ECF subfamily)